MSMLQARGLALRYAQDQPLFHAVDFDINPGDRIAVVGPNGAGKSSLLRVIAGGQPPDAGAVTKRRGLAIAQFAPCEDQIYEWPEDVEPVLRGLGFDTEDFYTPLRQLSAGQRCRAFLARALTQPADLLLLDEPTNHLDARARAWLEAYLLRQARTCVFVSHDEDFLNNIATRVFEIRRGQFREYTGNYGSYRVQVETRMNREHAAYDREQRQLAQWERAAQRRDRLATKVSDTPAGGGISRAFYGRKAATVARTGRLLRERLPPEARQAKPWEEQAIPKLDFLNYTRPGDPPLHIENLAVSYGGAPIVEGLNLTVRLGERWAIRGPNGCGKTTLFRAILGDLQPKDGRIVRAANLRIGYFAQEAETLDPGQTPLEACQNGCAGITRIRTLLACLKLPRDRAQVPIRQLSLGERAKTALAQVLVSGANLLLLDEPTNHLEIEARHALTETLLQYPGAILAVSHDDSFLETLSAGNIEIAPTRRLGKTVNYDSQHDWRIR